MLKPQKVRAMLNLVRAAAPSATPATPPTDPVVDAITGGD